ncbi:MAG: proprotein convertase P-domain-containing protein [Candidatus Delongbacteria bacterium]|nr:proprotein convertase P-domain-containing protein [Candidatus Delongbacteria bacterium]
MSLSKNLLSTLLLGSALASAASAAELWSSGEGNSSLRLDTAALQAYGLRVLVGAERSERGTLSSAIDPSSNLTFRVSEHIVLPDFRGRLRQLSPLALSGPSGSLAATHLELADTDMQGHQAWQLLSPEGAVIFELGNVKLGFIPNENSLALHADQVHISPKVARSLGLSMTGKEDLGSLDLELEAFWVGGDLPDSRPVNAPGTGPELDPDRVTAGPDMAFCQLYGLYQASRTGSDVEFSLGTTSWNIGDTDLQWFSGLGNYHPYIEQNLFRVNANDRFEQISASWVKHGFYALSSFQCDLPDLPNCIFEAGHGAGNWLGQGCTDTYSPGLNASGLRPRTEINPWTGQWSGVTFTGDYALYTADSDLDPAQNSGATYFSEGLYIIADDVDPTNSVAWKPVSFSGSPGGTWGVSMSGSGTLPNYGPALDAWGGQTTLVAQQIPVIHENMGGAGDSPDGRAYLSTKNWDNGNGTWHYEYVIYNLDMQRKIDEFSIPVSAGTTIGNIDFHAPLQFDAQPYQSAANSPYTNDAWSSSQSGGFLTFATTSNPIRWGVAYSFGFDCNQPPAATSVLVGLYEAGSPSSIDASTTGPAQGPADCNNNSVPDDVDIDNGTSLDCNSNGVPDECEPDCNNNGIPDGCDISGGFSQDCNGNSIPDECEVDCNNNGIPDDCDIANGASDCNNNGVPDECETWADCNNNGISDACDIASGFSQDCNENGTPDECDIAEGTSLDEDLNGIPDECETVCGPVICPDGQVVFGNTSGKLPGENHGSSSCGTSATSPDVFFRYTPGSSGTATVETCGYGDYDTVLSVHTDCPGTTANQIACNDDNCTNYKSSITWAVTGGTTYTIRVSGYNNASGDFGLTLTGPACSLNFPDCNGNLVDDAQDIAGGFSQDCNTNGIPDECDIASGFSLDCNANGVPDECDISGGFSADCNANGYPDECEFVGGGFIQHDFERTGLSLAIPDNDPIGVTDELVIGENIAIADLSVTLDIAHTYNGDLIATLEHVESGTLITLLDRPGVPGSTYGSNSNGFQVTLADAFANDIETAHNGNTGLVTGDWHPSPGALADFDGEMTLGTWRLNVSDAVGSDIGQIQAWGLHLVTSGVASNDCNENGILDECDIASGNETDINDNGVPDSCEGLDPYNWESTYFSGANNCRTCHNASPGEGIYFVNGEDTSPYSLWEASMMANAARDPYWKAKVGFEVSQMPPAFADAIENTCTTCHAPMGHTENMLLGDGVYTMADLSLDVKGQEGVSCTLCHQQTQGSDPGTWSGNFNINTNREIYGPYNNQSPVLMQNTVNYTPMQSPGFEGSQTCVSCHTLFTDGFDGQGNVVASFPEQVPFLENQNSDHAGTSCVECHMLQSTQAQQISTLPGGLPNRSFVGRHDVVGGNTMMLELMAANAASLGAFAEPAAFQTLADRSLQFVAQGTGLSGFMEEVNGQPMLNLDVDNFTGHKFPTGIPVRRAWLEVIAYDGLNQEVFHSGAVNAAGIIAGTDGSVEPHHQLISDEMDVQIYEGRMQNSDGQPTFTLLRAVGFAKDNRLLPSGYSMVGPHAATTLPAGNALTDPDFMDGTGGDRVQYLLPATTTNVVARLHFQSVNPESIDPMRAVGGVPDITEFLGMWDALDRSGEIVHETSLVFFPMPALTISTSGDDAVLSWNGGQSWIVERKVNDAAWTSMGLQASGWIDAGMAGTEQVVQYRLKRN